jgi:hypothetical protein
LSGVGFLQDAEQLDGGGDVEDGESVAVGSAVCFDGEGVAAWPLA